MYFVKQELKEELKEAGVDAKPGEIGTLFRMSRPRKKQRIDADQ